MERVGGRWLEAESPVEELRVLVDRMHEDRAHANLIRDASAANQSVHQQGAPHPFALVVDINRKACDQERRDKSARRLTFEQTLGCVNGLNRSGREGIEADDAGSVGGDEDLRGAVCLCVSSVTTQPLVE